MADVRGGMFNFKTDLRLLSTQTDVDGEIYVFLTETDTGFPQIQLIPSTMVGQRNAKPLVEDGPYKGLQICQGVIINDKGTAVAYRVLGQKVDDDKDYSARDLIQIGDPKTSDQVRFFPAFTHAILDLKDLRLIQGNEKIISIIASTIGLIEQNELGTADPNDPANFLRKTNNQFMLGTDSIGPQITTKNYNGVSTQYFRAGTGSKLEQLKNERPGDVWDKFMNRLIRNACVGMGWPYELTWDASALGGANVRLLVSKAMRTVEDRQDLLRPVARRIVGYAVAKAIKMGALPPNPEWYEWDFSMPPNMSVDYGREAVAELNDYKFGLKNMADILSEQGIDLEDHVAARIRENEMLAAAGLPSYGPSAREATDINAPPPSLPGDPQQSQNPTSNPKA
jgi:capsid protein